MIETVRDLIESQGSANQACLQLENLLKNKNQSDIMELKRYLTDQVDEMFTHLEQELNQSAANYYELSETIKSFQSQAQDSSIASRLLQKLSLNSTEKERDRAQRSQLIAKAIEILNAKDFDSVLLQHDGFPRCKISNKCQQLGEIIQLTQDQIQVKNLVDLYLLLVPQNIQRQKLDQLVSTQATLMNDLQFLAFLIEAYQSYQEKLMNLSYEKYCFILNQFHDECKQILQSTLNRFDLKRINVDENVQIEVEQALKQVVFSLRQFSKQLKQIFSTNVYLATLSKFYQISCKLLDELVYERLLELNNGDLTAEQCEILYGLFIKLSESDESDFVDSFGFLDKVEKLISDEVQTLQRLQQSFGILQNQSSENALENILVQDVISDATLSFRQKAQILNMSLISIENGINTNKFDYLDKETISRLVKGIFATSEARSRLLEKLKSKG